jgi:light-regulated signal transduction histidine kinase (bacteriophytochrome)
VPAPPSLDARRLGELLDEVGRAASHDLVEPLAASIGFLRALDSGHAGPLVHEAREFVAIALANAERAQARIRALAAWARLWRRPVALAPVDLGEACARALGELAPALDACGARVEVGVLPRVCGDEELLVELFRRLAENSIAFRGGQPPEISVSAVVEEAAVRLTFADRGVGIDPRFVDRVLALFARLVPYDQVPGEGVGLAFARAIVELHGGSIRARSRPSGAAIEIVLPLGPEKKKPAAEGPAAGSMGNPSCGVVSWSDPPE